MAEVEKYSNRKVEVVSLKSVRKVNPVPETSNEKNVFRPSMIESPKPKEYKRVENKNKTPEKKARPKHRNQ